LVLALTWVRLPQWVDAVEKAPNCFAASFPPEDENKRRFLVDIVPIPDMQVRSNKGGYVSISFMKMNGNSTRFFAFVRPGNPCAPDSPSARLPRQALSQQLTEGCDHATGQARFEAETHNQTCRLGGAGCRRTESFAGGQRIRIHNAYC
jgi:hypothetical protein